MTGAAGEVSFSPFPERPVLRVPRVLRSGPDASEGVRVLGRGAWALLVAWFPLLVLAALESRSHPGTLRAFFENRLLQAEILFAVPVLFGAEPYAHGRLSAVVPTLRRAGILTLDQFAVLDAATSRLRGWRDSFWPSAVAVVVAYALVIVRLLKGAPPDSPLHVPLSPMGLWYAAFSLPFFLALLLTWAWRFVLWSALLNRLARLSLAVVPSHADQLGGLRVLAVAQATFAPLVFAVGCVVAASSAPLGSGAARALMDVGKTQVIYALAALVVVHLPLATFCGPLLRAKRDSDARMSALVAHQARAFTSKWYPAQRPGELLGSEDPPSRIDLSSTYQLALKMRWFPVAMRPVLSLAFAALVALVPRLLIEHQLLDVILHFGKDLLG